MQALLAPSLLSADFTILGEQIKKCETGGADWLHLDVMDGRFVPPITFGAGMCSAIKSVSRLPVDVHLMIVEPEKQIDFFIDAGADYLTIHIETCPHLHRILDIIQQRGVKAGVSLNPATPLVLIESVLDRVDLVLVMSVNPGWGGQRYLRIASDKITQLSNWKRERSYPYLIEVDGGVSYNNIFDIAKFGAEVFVAGNAVFQNGSIEDNLRSLRQQISSNL